MGPPSTPVLPDDLLLEVFSRLPHSASAIRCSSVCNTWPSLIHKLNHHNHHHYHGGGDYSDCSYSRPYTLLFKFQRSMTKRFMTTNMCSESGIYDSLDPTDDVLYTPYGPSHLRNSAHYLDFIPWQLRLSHVAACGGDFLVLRHNHSYNFYICNLLTRKCSPLPYGGYEAHFPVYGLAWDCRRRDQYRVVIASNCSTLIDEVDEFEFRMHIFSPETGEWRPFYPALPRALTPLGYKTIDCCADAVACVGGLLYFPTGSLEDYDRKITGILGVDPFHSEGGEIVPVRFIPLPAFFPANELRTKVCFGVVRGRLRLSHSRLYYPMRVINLRIWELTNSDEELTNSDDVDVPVPWLLIHHVHLLLEDVGRMLVPALHPNNGDVVFVLRDNDICSYNVREDQYHKIGEIPDIQHPQRVKDQLHLFFNVFTLLH